MNWELLIPFVGYLIVLVIIGLLALNKTKTYGMFFIAGRKLRILATALSAQATDMSAWLTIGLPGQAFLSGIGTIWVGIGCSLGTLLNWSGLAQRLRIYTGKLGSFTIPDFLESRYKDDTRILRLVSSILILIFMTAFVGAVAKGGAKAVEAATGIDFLWALVVTYLIILFYTFAGGFWAVAWTDVFQAILMIIILVVMPIVGLFALRDMGGISHAINQLDPSMLDPVGGLSGVAALSFVLGYFAWIVGYPGQPHIVTRFIAVEDPRKLRRPGSIIGMLWVLIGLWGAVALGIVGAAYFHGGLADPEMVTPELAKALLPLPLAGCVIAAIMAAMMSTVDSQLLVATSALVQDILVKLIKPTIKQENLLKIARIGTIIIAAASFYAGVSGSKFVFWAVSFAWGCSAATFGPLLLISIWWKKATKAGAIAGLIIGAIGDISFEYMGIKPLGAPAYFTWFFITAAIIIAVSLLTKPPEKVDREFEEIFRFEPVAESESKIQKIKARAKTEFDVVESFYIKA